MILIKNGRIIDPHSKRDEVVDIVIRDNKILKIGKCSLTDEYEKVIDYALELGMEDGFIQEGEAAKESFIPEFNLEGIGI